MPNSCLLSAAAVSNISTLGYHCAIPSPVISNRLAGRAPDGLEEAVLLCEPVQAVVGLAHGADEAGDGVDLVVTGVATVLVNLANAQLDRGVVLGPDDASGSRLEGVSIAARASDTCSTGTHAFTGDVDCEAVSDGGSRIQCARWRGRAEGTTPPAAGQGKGSSYGQRARRVRSPF
jgi:hypothetical protein